MDIVRDSYNKSFHIDKLGQRVYTENYLYCGDFKDGYTGLRQQVNRLFKHIDIYDHFIYDTEFIDLGLFHKGHATARDMKGWHHITLEGKELYLQRFKDVEPFYAGFALVTQFDDSKMIIEETGEMTLNL